MNEELLELKVKMRNTDEKDVIYQYLKTCNGQLDIKQCAADLQIAVEDVIKAVALLEGEGKIRVDTEEPPTEVAQLDTETKEPKFIEFVTPSEEEAVPPSFESTAEATPEETPQEQAWPLVEPITSTERHEVLAVEAKEENPVEPTPTAPFGVEAEEAPTEAPEPKPIEVFLKEEMPIEKPAEVSVETEPSEAPAEKPAAKPLEPSVPPVETSFNIAAAPEPAAAAVNPSERQPTTQHRSIEPIVITEGQIILEKPKAPKPSPNRETQQIQRDESPPKSQSTAAAPTTPRSEISKQAICTRCGLPTKTLIKQWSIKGRIAKKSVLISLYRCPTCSTVFRSAETMENEA